MKAYKSKIWMHKKYVVERWTEEEIADFCNTTQATINRWLYKHEIKRK